MDRGTRFAWRLTERLTKKRRKQNDEINETIENTSAIITLEGRLDATTAPELEELLRTGLEGIMELELDLEKLDYISSAGLRVLLSAQKKMNLQGRMTVKHVNETIMEIFEATGFADILTIE